MPKESWIHKRVMKLVMWKLKASEKLTETFPALFLVWKLKKLFSPHKFSLYFFSSR